MACSAAAGFGEQRTGVDRGPHVENCQYVLCRIFFFLEGIPLFDQSPNALAFALFWLLSELFKDLLESLHLLLSLHLMLLKSLLQLRFSRVILRQLP